MCYLENIERRISQEASKIGLSKNKLLQECGLSKSVFDNMKKGQTPSVDKIHTIANRLGISVDYILGRETMTTHHGINEWVAKDFELKEETHCICYIDLLGCRDYVLRGKLTASDMATHYFAIKKALKDIEGNDYIKELPEAKFYSDNILLYRKCTSEEEKSQALKAMIFVASSFQSTLLSGKRFLTRGGVCFGDIYIDDDIVFGKGLIDAYTLESKEAKNPRIVISENVRFDVSRLKSNQGSEMVKVEADGYRYINYLSLMSDRQLDEVIIDETEDCGKCADERSKSKIEWVIKEAKEEKKHRLSRNNINWVPLIEKMKFIPEIGEAAAGYGKNALRQYSVTELLPSSILNNAPEEEYFTLRIDGDSMLPQLADGDKVLCLRCTSVDSGSIAVVLYDSDIATVKKVEHVEGGNWVDLVPFNPDYKRKHIEGADLENCRILGKVVKLIRDI